MTIGARARSRLERRDEPAHEAATRRDRVDPLGALVAANGSRSPSIPSGSSSTTSTRSTRAPSRTLVTQRHEALHGVRVAFEDRLDGSVAVVAHPAADAGADGAAGHESRKNTPCTSPWTTTRRRIIGGERCLAGRPRRRRGLPAAGARAPRSPPRARARRRAERAGARAGPSNRALDRSVAVRRRRPHRHRLGPDDLGVVDVRDAEEASDVLVDGPRPELVRRRDLDDPPGAHHRHAVAERERLGLVVGDVDGGQRELVEEAGEVVEEPVAQPPVERSERLVEEEQPRGSGASARASATRCCSPPESVPTDRRSKPGEADELEQLACALAIARGIVAAHAQAEADVLRHVAMREERVILEDEADAAAMRRNACEILPVEQDPSLVGHLEPGDDAQERRLARAARPEHRDDLAARDLERRVVERRVSVELDRDAAPPEASEPPSAADAHPLDEQHGDDRQHHEHDRERVGLRDVDLAGAVRGSGRSRPAASAGRAVRGTPSRRTRRARSRTRTPAATARPRETIGRSISRRTRAGRRAEQGGRLALARVDRAQRRHQDPNDERDGDERLRDRDEPRRGAEVERRGVEGDQEPEPEHHRRGAEREQDQAVQEAPARLGNGERREAADDHAISVAAAA